MIIVRQYYLFLVNPRNNYSLADGRNPLRAFVTVLFITYVQLSLVSIIPSNQPAHVIQLLESTSENIWLLLLIPMYEELLFRLPLKITTLNVYISLSLLPQAFY
jgi:hypothetical protein